MVIFNSYVRLPEGRLVRLVRLVRWICIRYNYIGTISIIFKWTICSYLWMRCSGCISMNCYLNGFKQGKKGMLSRTNDGFSWDIVCIYIYIYNIHWGTQLVPIYHRCGRHWKIQGGLRFGKKWHGVHMAIEGVWWKTGVRIPCGAPRIDDSKGWWTVEHVSIDVSPICYGLW